MNDQLIQLPGCVVVCDTMDELLGRLGQAWADAAKQAVAKQGVFHAALSGGSTPKPFYEMLASDARYSDLPWAKTHLWIVDERRVPEDDEQNNYRMIHGALVDRVAVPAGQVHPVPVLADDPAAGYEQELRRVFGDEGTARLDFVVLGMGDDAHTASLFPGSPALSVYDKWVVNNIGPQVTPPPRITMTYPLLNAARHVAVLATGSKKAPTLRRVEKQLSDHGPDSRELPITGIKPTDGTLTWYLDAAAVG